MPGAAGRERSAHHRHAVLRNVRRAGARRGEARSSAGRRVRAHRDVRSSQSELEAAPAPYLSLIPPGTMLRAFYITERGDAFVDLSPEVSTMHPGGSTNELLTVYAIVNAVTANLSSVERVQILIDGKQADTLAGPRRPAPSVRARHCRSCSETKRAAAHRFMNLHLHYSDTPCDPTDVSTNSFAPPASRRTT